MSRRLIVVLMVVLVAGAVGVGAVPAEAGGGGHGICPELTDLQTADVHMANSCFSPTVARVEPGDTLTFTNKDMYVHAVTGVGGTFGDLEKEIVRGDSVSFRFDDEGTYPYMCIFHPGMAGVVVVGDGEGDAAAAGGVVPLPPASGEKQEAPAESKPVADRSSWVVPAGIALVLGLLAIAALPMRRRRTPLITTKI